MEIIRKWVSFQKSSSKNFYDNLKLKQHYIDFTRAKLSVAKETYLPLRIYFCDFKFFSLYHNALLPLE